ncbi:arginase [Ignavibacteria bacterium]|nr:arginase [Bacteroidota bacterium]MCZ2132551.1 arginase [Bacteroidota bacterium]
MNNRVRIIGFPMDLGAGRRGVDMGPSALRIAGVGEKLEQLGYIVTDGGDVPIQTPEVLTVEDARLKYLPEITKACSLLAGTVHRVLNGGEFPLILGGDHSMSIGSIAGIAAHCREYDKRLGVIWIDAHSDINTPETSPSGNIHGMPVAALLGIGAAELTEIAGFSPKLKPENIAMIGLRSVDTGEKELIRHLQISAYTMFDIDKQGIFPIVEKILESMRRNVDHLHISFDVDSVDPKVAPGVGTPIPGGLSYREAHLIMELIAESGILSSFEIAEVNPILDKHNASAEFAAGVVASCMGKRIL